MDIKKSEFDVVINMIETRRTNAYRKINEEMMGLYWDFGKYLSEAFINTKWGDKYVAELANYINEKYPTLKGFDKRALYRMKQLYETYKDNPFVVPLVPQISWSNHLLILRATKTIEEKEFYIKMSIKENYSKRELDRQIDSGYYHRYMLSEGNSPMSVSETIDEDDYPNTKILDTYSLEFLDLPMEFKEKDLRKAIVINLKDFILEIGKSFTFVGEEYRISIGNHDYFIDLLFFNREYSCLVAVELKIGEFKAEYISKMDLYLEALDRDLKKKKENPSVGIILCSSKDDTIVEYALSRSLSQTAVSEFKLDLIDRKLLENKLKELQNLIDNE